MMLDDQNSLAKPLLDDDDDAAASSSSGVVVVSPLLFLSLLAALALWSSHEASKGFKLTIVNDLPADSRLGRRFDLFYVSDDRATRVLLNASAFVEDLLYGGGGDGTAGKKTVSHVTLRLGGGDFPGEVSVTSYGEEKSRFNVDLSPKVMEGADVDGAVKSAVLRGMARVWVYDDGVPREIVSGVVEYIAMTGGFGGEWSTDLLGSEDPMIRCGQEHSDWFVDKDPRLVARMLARCEEDEIGFIRRFNGAMRNGWGDRTVENALRKPA